MRSVFLHDIRYVKGRGDRNHLSWNENIGVEVMGGCRNLKWNRDVLGLISDGVFL